MNLEKAKSIAERLDYSFPKVMDELKSKGLTSDQAWNLLKKIF